MVLCAPVSLLPETPVVFPVEQSDPSLWDSCNSLTSHLFPPDLVHMPVVSSPQPPSKGPRYTELSSQKQIRIVLHHLK